MRLLRFHLRTFVAYRSRLTDVLRQYSVSLAVLGLAFGLIGLPPPAWGFGEYYSLSRSVRALGMGNAFHSLSDDEGALFYNPAGLALYGGGVQVMLASAQGGISSDALSSIGTLTEALQNEGAIDDVISRLVSLQGNLNSANAGVMPYFLSQGFAVGVLIGDVKANMALLGRELDSELDVTFLTDSGLLVSKSFSLGKNFHIGITGKYLIRSGGRQEMSILDFAQQTAADFGELGGSGRGVDFDLGMTWEVAKPAVGQRMGFSAVIQNVLATEFPGSRGATGGPPGLTRTVSAGTYSVLKNGMVLRLDLAEFALGGQSDPDLGARGGSVFKHLNWGIEYPLGQVLSLRTGFHQGNFSAGFGVTLPVLRLDVATYGEEMGTHVGTFTSRRFALRLAVGFAASPYHSYQ